MESCDCDCWRQLDRCRCRRRCSWQWQRSPRRWRHLNGSCGDGSSSRRAAAAAAAPALLVEQVTEAAHRLLHRQHGHPGRITLDLSHVRVGMRVCVRGRRVAMPVASQTRDARFWFRLPPKHGNLPWTCALDRDLSEIGADGAVQQWRAQTLLRLASAKTTPLRASSTLEASRSHATALLQLKQTPLRCATGTPRTPTPRLTRWMSAVSSSAPTPPSRS